MASKVGRLIKAVTVIDFDLGIFGFVIDAADNNFVSVIWCGTFNVVTKENNS